MTDDPVRADTKPAGAFSDPDLLRRVASALVMIPVALAAAWLGGWPFAVLWLAAALVVLWEWNGLVLGGGRRVLLGVEGAALVLAVVALALSGAVLVEIAVLAIGLSLAAGMTGEGQRPWAMAGFGYASAVVLGPVILRADPIHGATAIFWLFAVVWGTDVAAYFAGRAIGGPKLWPQLSPKKTWAGFIGGTVVGTILGLAVAHVAGIRVGIGLGLVTFVLAALSQGGDLFESYVKRRFSAKDAGTLIPGHGGVMDRLDGFLVATTVAALVGLLRGGTGHAASGILIW
jgi:phosphatidate cytidylyltransferase